MLKHAFIASIVLVCSQPAFAQTPAEPAGGPVKVTRILDTPETRAIGHKNYEYVAADRSAVLAAWTSAKVMDVIVRRRIQLTNCRELLAKR